MKTLKFTTIFLTVLALNSCGDKDEVINDGLELPYNKFIYMLWFSFQDESGNDLLGRSSETKPYISNRNHELYYKVLENNPYDDHYCLALNFYIEPSSTFSSFENKIVFRFKDSSMFGDNEEHEIVTWWKPENDTEQGKLNPICYSVEYDGKEFSVEKISNVNLATIILDK